MSSIISNQASLKCKDPGCPIFSIVIGNNNIHEALLDLGASVDLLPFTMCERLGLEELKPTKMVLQLDDDSTMLPREMAEDVFIKVGKFIFPVDFVVLETEVLISRNNEMLAILG